MANDDCELNLDGLDDCVIDQELGRVAGGMTCAQGLAAYNTCKNVSDYFGSLGMSETASYFSGLGVGYGRGACN